MPRYEFSEGTSNKFWEIEREGNVVTTRWGRIGTAGQSKDKDLGSDDKAQKEYDKLVAEKTKKGYQLVGDGGSPASARPAAAAKPAAKPATAKKATPAAAAPPPQPVAVEPGWTRYELVEGSSSKFWEIRREGEEVITRYGRIGAKGQSTTKEFDSGSEARQEFKKLVAQKTKKGYRLVGGGKAGAVPTGARNPELEAEIVKDPDNPELFSVYGDWLQTQGDVRGELVTIQRGLAQNPKDKDLRAAEKKLLTGHLAHFFGAEQPVDDDDLKKPARKAIPSWRRRPGWPEEAWTYGHTMMVWENGFVRRLLFDTGYYYDGEDDLGGEDAGELLSEILAHPSMRFVREIFIGDIWGDDYEGPELGHAVHAIAGAPCGDVLQVIDFYGGDHDISGVSLDLDAKLFKNCPRLEELGLYGGQLSLGRIEMPRGRKLSIYTGGLDRDNLKDILKARCPELEELDLMFGDEEYGADCTVDDLKPLLVGKLFPKLKHLGLKNADFTDGLCAVLPRSKILAQLEALDLSLGTLSDDGVQQIVDHAEAFAHLKKLDVEDNFIGEEAQKKLVAALPDTEVNIGDQDDADDPDDRYVSVGE